MSSQPAVDAVNPLASAAVGDSVLEREIEVSRDRLVRYASASGDFNPIHYNDAFAESVGLPGVIAHGMLTMGLAGGALTDWLESWDPAGIARVVSYGTRFARPIPVPALESVTVVVTGVVGAVELADADGAPCVRIDLKAVVDGVSVLAKTQALVRV
ncbi:MaoC/PaaZ C-terminal domain-containing protein [Salana multivorans]